MGPVIRGTGLKLGAIKHGKDRRALIDRKYEEAFDIIDGWRDGL